MYKIKKNNKEVKGEIVKFNEQSDYVAIQINGDTELRVAHKILAKRLVSKGVASIVEGVEITKPATNFVRTPIIKEE